MANPNDYIARKTANERSQSWAKRTKKRWTPYDEAYILDQWVFKAHDSRDEEAVSRHLERTIESCRMEAEHLRKVLGISADRSFTRSGEPEIETCDRCWTVLSANGLCLCTPD
jgi:hypothetical protein